VIESTIARMWVFGRIADGSEDGAAVAFGNPAVTTQRAARIYSFSGYVGATIKDNVRNFAFLSHATDPQMPTVQTTKAGSLAVALVGQNDNNTAGDATGESGGNWVEAVAEFTANLTPGLMLQIQTCTPTSDPGTVSGGSVATTNDPCGVIAFQVMDDGRLSVTGVASGEAHGSTKVNQSVAPGSASSSEAHGSTSVSVSSGLSVLPGAISSLEAHGSPKILQEIFFGTEAATFAHRTSGEAPYGVLFSACDTPSPSYTSGVRQPPSGVPWRKIHCEWDFGDPSSGNWSNGWSKNYHVGPTAAHVYENPGTYIAILTMRDERGVVRRYAQTVTVSAFSGSTRYISTTDGNDSNDGLSTGSPWATIQKVQDNLAADTRYLFKRGDVYTANSTWTWDEDNVTLGAYGTGARPRWNNTAGGVRPVRVDCDDFRLISIELDGFDDEVGLHFPSDPAARTNALFLDCDVHNWDSGLDGTFDTNDVLPDAIFFVGGTIHDVGQYNTILDGRRVAFLGSHFHSPGTQHLLRSGAWHQGVVAHCEMEGDSVNTGLKLHSQDNSSAVPKTMFVSFYRNRWSGASVSLDIRPQNSEVDERVENIFVEADWFEGGPVQQTAVYVSARKVAIRNCVFVGDGSYGSGLSNDFKALIIARRGAEPAPDDVFFGNNTGYVGATAPSGFYKMVAFFSGDCTNCVLVNNLSYADGVGDEAFLEGTGSTGFVNDNNLHTTTPGFTDAPNDDFTLAGGSVAIDDGGTYEEVRKDFNGAFRPVGSAYDLGAFERNGVPELLDGGGVPSQEAHGSLKLNLQIIPSGVASGEAHGNTTVSVEAAEGTIAPAGIASQEAHGSPQVNLQVRPDPAASAEAHGSTTISVAGAPQTVIPGGIASAEAHGQESLAQQVRPGGIASDEQHGSTTVSLPAPQVISPTGIESAEAHGQTTIVGGTQAAPRTGGGLASNWRELLEKALKQKQVKKPEPKLRVARLVSLSATGSLSSIGGSADAGVSHGVRMGAMADLGSFSTAAAAHLLVSASANARMSQGLDARNAYLGIDEEKANRDLSLQHAVAESRDELLEAAMSDGSDFF